MANFKKLKHNKSPGPDDIPPRILKELSEYLSLKIVKIIIPSYWPSSSLRSFIYKGWPYLPMSMRTFKLFCPFFFLYFQNQVQRNTHYAIEDIFVIFACPA